MAGRKTRNVQYPLLPLITNRRVSNTVPTLGSEQIGGEDESRDGNTNPEDRRPRDTSQDTSHRQHRTRVTEDLSQDTSHRQHRQRVTEDLSQDTGVLSTDNIGSNDKSPDTGRIIASNIHSNGNRLPVNSKSS